MRRRREILMLAVVAIALSGCQALGIQPPERPVDRYALAVDSYALVMETAMNLHDSGFIDDADLVQIYGVSRIARNALDMWAVALEEERDPVAARERFNDALERMWVAIGTEGGGEEGSDADEGGADNEGD